MLIRVVDNVSRLKNIYIRPTDDLGWIDPIHEWHLLLYPSGFRNKWIQLYMHMDSHTVVAVPGGSLAKGYPVFRKRLQNLMDRFGFDGQFSLQYLDKYPDPVFAQADLHGQGLVADFDYWPINECLRTYDSFESIDYDYLENMLFTLDSEMGNGAISPLYFWDQHLAGHTPKPLKSDEIETYQPLKLRIPKDHHLLLPWENLHMENQLLRANLEDHLGGIVREFGSPADIWIENMFLKRVTEFIEQFKEPKTVTPRMLMGNPTYPPLHQIPKRDLRGALGKIMKDLKKVNLRVDFLASYPYAVRYSFLVDELLDHEFEHVDLADTFTTFIYEEFHPNHRHDIKEMIERILFQALHRKESDEFTLSMFTKQFKLNGKKASFEDLIDTVAMRIKEIRFMEICTQTISLIDIDESGSKKARALLCLEDHSRVKLTFEFLFKYCGRYFLIAGINLT